LEAVGAPVEVVMAFSALLELLQRAVFRFWRADRLEDGTERDELARTGAA
jgi:hypothetical protein